MAFTDYKNLEDVVLEFGLANETTPNLFPQEFLATPGPGLSFFLTHMVRRALAQKSEKARSEWIISPFLAEASIRASLPTMVYSGMALRVTPKLTGYPDFMLGRGNDPGVLKAPLLAIVEAKDEKFGEGGGACVAQMVAAREFNKTQNQNLEGPIFGCVTNGVEWYFYRLTENQLVWQDTPELYLPAERLLGILIAIGSGTVGLK